MRAAENTVPSTRGFWSRLSSHAWWPHAKRGVALAFFVLIAWLLVDQARGIKWDEVIHALRQLPRRILFFAAVLAALSFTVYTTFDLIGRAYTRQDTPTRYVMLVAFISYAFTLSLGTVVGGVAFRYRLYSKFGMANEAITRVMGLSMWTNWLGYVALSGIVLLIYAPILPEQWQIEQTMLPAIGGVLLGATAIYLLLCAFSIRRSLQWRSHVIELPTFRMALMQTLLSMLHWIITASIIYTALQARIDYSTVLGVLLVAAVAGVIAHVPAGLGVLEAVFVAMLSSQLPATDLLAGLLAYRAVYYLLPLAVAALLFAHIEWRTHAS
jgi:uncharacterized membrane protein YbhN (UPF0104 family)